MEHFNKNEIIIEVRKGHFDGKYSIRLETGKDEFGAPIYYANGMYSTPCAWAIIKKYLKSINVDAPDVKDMHFFSDGFAYSFAWFDGYGKVIGR